MGRIAGVVLAALLAGTLSACGSVNSRRATHAAAHHVWSYTRAQVRNVFAAHGLPLSSRYLRVIVLPPVPPGTDRAVCSAAGGTRRPRKWPRDCATFVWFSKAEMGSTRQVFSNGLEREALGHAHGVVEAVYLGGHGLDARVKAAMASLPR